MTTDAAADAHIEPSGMFLAWLKSLDLLGFWQQTAELPLNRCDLFRRELLRLYAIERRKVERSQRFQLTRGSL